MSLVPDSPADTPAPRHGAAPITPAAQLNELERLVQHDVGPLGAALGPLFDEARALFVALDPPPAVQPLGPEAQVEARARLGALLDTLEDRIDALRLGPAAAGAGRA